MCAGESHRRLAALRDRAAMNDVDVLCITETWLKPKHLSSSLLLPDFHPPTCPS